MNILSEKAFLSNIEEKKYNFIIALFNLDYMHVNKIDCILPIAIKYNYVDSIKLLIESGACPSYNNFSAIYYCLHTDNTNAFIKIIQHNKNIDLSFLKELRLNKDFLDIYKRYNNLNNF
jgi:hypothetical protein